MPDTLKVAIVGIGGEARFYWPSFSKKDESEIVLVQDIDEEKVAQQGEKIGVPWTLGFEDVLASDADVVHISTPNHLHAEQTIACLEAGKHVSCQKPMARTALECDSMIAAAERTGKRLGVFMGGRGVPLHNEIRDMIAARVFGDVSSVASRGAHRGGWLAKDRSAWRGSKEKVGGGVFIQLAIHTINLTQWMLGDTIERVAGFSKNLLCERDIGGDDLTHAVVEYQSGRHGSFESGYAAEDGWLGVFGTCGSILETGGKIYFWSDTAWRGRVIEYDPSDGKQWWDRSDVAAGAGGWGAELDQNSAFIRAVRDGTPLPVTADEARHDVAVIEAVYRSAEIGRTVEVSEIG